MALHLALMIDPAAPEDARTDFSRTFTEVAALAPAVSVQDLGAQRGDGVFESIGVVDGHAQEVQAHLERLARSAELCDLPAPHPGQWRQAIARAEAVCGAGESVIKLILSRGVEGGPAPSAWLTAAPAADFSRVRAHGVRVVTLDRGYDSALPARAPWLLLGAKTLSYAVNMAALREAGRRGADDALFVSADGRVLEAPTASLVVRSAGTFSTPRPEAGILHGTTQVSIFSWLGQQGHTAQYRPLSIADVRAADAAWLVSSVRLAAPICAIDGEPLPVDAAFTASLNEYLRSPRD